MLVQTITLVVACILGYCVLAWISRQRCQMAYAIAEKVFINIREKIRQRENEIQHVLRQETEIRQNYQQMIAELGQSNEILSQKLDLQEKDLDYREAKLCRQQEKLLQFQKEIQEKIAKNDVCSQKIEFLQENIQKTLLEKSGCVYSELKEIFFNDFHQKMEEEYLKAQENLKYYLHTNAERIASRILSTAIHRCFFGHWFENYPSSLNIEDISLCEEILQPNIQNIFRNELDVKLDYEQGIILIITADGCKREITRCVLTQMINNKIFSPNTVKIWIQQTRLKLEKEITETGRAVCFELGINLPEEICNLLGRLKYRTSFGQNVLWHSIEVAHLAKILAYEIGLNPQIACRAGLLHDIGKSVDHEQEGGHPEIGGEILRRFCEPIEVLEGVIGHHESAQVSTPYATLISTADAISASRPGARRETFEKYIHRLEKLETIAYNIEGVENAYAISAGREIRLIVAPDKISDADAPIVAQNIAQAIEQELHYPGKIKITLIREMKVVEYAH